MNERDERIERKSSRAKPKGNQREITRGMEYESKSRGKEDKREGEELME